MPKTTQLPLIPFASTATSFVVVDNKLTKRLDYTTLFNSFTAQVSDRLLVGPTGPQGVPGPAGGPIPIGGTAGQILVKTTSTNYAVEWRDPTSGIPRGGSSGQLLAKTSSADYSVGWVNSTSLPPGGTTGQILAKTSSTDYTAGWVTNAPLPAGGTTGQVLLKSSNANYDATWGESISVPLGGTSGQVLAKLSNTDRDIGWVDPEPSEISSRRIFSTSTAVISDGAVANITLPSYENYVVLKIETSHPAWVRLYSDQASRTADSTRAQGADPAPGKGIIAEVVTNEGFLTQLITPGIVGMNFDTIPNNNMYLSVKNNSGQSRSITINLTLLSLSGLASIVTSTRVEVGQTTASLENNSTGNITVIGSKAYMLSKISTSAPAWVRVYTDASKRSTDASRSIDNDPVPGSGVIAEVLTSVSALSQIITPGAIGFNTDTIVSNNLYLAVTNKSGSTAPIAVILTLVPIEV